MGGNDVGVLLLVAAFFLAVFLIGRELVLWYWKVNRVVELLESIEEKLAQRDR